MVRGYSRAVTVPRFTGYTVTCSGFPCALGFTAALPRALYAQPQPPQVPLAAPQEENLFTSGFFLKLGFSFIVGLAVGYALKVAFKIALVVGGLLLVLLFGLQHGGVIEINWAGMESNYDSFVDWLAAYASGLKDFMADNLSNAASFTTGLLLGLRL